MTRVISSPSISTSVDLSFILFLAATYSSPVDFDALAKDRKIAKNVIPAKAGIQKYQ
jgi:hypothetical protein